MKFLVTGSAGLVGTQVIKDLAESNDKIYSCYNNSKPELGIATPLDLTNSENIIKTVDNVKPDVIIHLAAMTLVDQCEKEKDLALEINAKATQTLARQAAKHGSFLVYVSTDYVFDGESGMKKENDITNPIDYYGRSKLEGEKALDDMASAWCIARTSTPFGMHKTRKSFPLFVAENLRAKKQVTSVTDQFTSPTYVPNLSKMLIEISTRQITGVIHTAGATRISRYDLASLVAEKLHLDQDLIKPVTIKEMNWTAKRPKDSSLDVSKATQILKEKPMKLEPALDLFLNELK
ncbi:MAG: dTDP-4-dehydrorhamnose reductase [Nitrosotalea sp.]